MVDVGAAAQLDRVVTDLDHPDDVPVLLAEQGDGAQAAGELGGGLVGAGGLVLGDAPVGQVLDLLEGIRRHGFEMREVEP